MNNNGFGEEVSKFCWIDYGNYCNHITDVHKISFVCSHGDLFIFFFKDAMWHNDLATVTREKQKREQQQRT